MITILQRQVWTRIVAVKFVRFQSQSKVGRNMESKTTMIRPVGVHHNWDLTKLSVKDIEENCESALKALKCYGDQAASASSLSYETVLHPIMEALRLYSERGIHGAVINITKYVADSADLRNAAVSAKTKLEAEFVDMEMRKDIYDNLVKYRDTVGTGNDLSEEQKKCLDRLILDGKRNGLQLDEATRDRVKELKKTIIGLCLEFSRKLADEGTVLLFTPEELKGLDSEFIGSLEKDTVTAGKLKVTLKYPHYVPIMQRCVVPETRKAVEFAYNSRCLVDNTKILEKVANLREERAKLLGYPTHASYVLEHLMSKNQETVQEFINDIIQKFTPAWRKEHEALLQIKKEESEKLGLEYDGKINMWDFSHYLTLVKEREYSLNQEELKQYFPMSVVTKGLLEIYQQLLGLSFTHLPNAERWNEEVEVYRVNDSETEELMGYFYLDLYPRDGKYGHACCEPSQQGCLDGNGTKQAAISVLICNFPRPTENSPALLTHDDVETFFHEFGHCMHGLCSRAETSMYFGSLVERDFVEAPSQMLENWCFEKESLQKMSAHHKTGAPIPDDMLNKLVKSRNANIGAAVLRQMVYALIDQRIHKEGRYELRKMYADTLKEVMGLDATPGTNNLASFAHLVNEYDAQYYGYMWSEVYSMDMFETVFKKHGVLSPVAGKLYRKSILEPGGSLDGMVMLKNFLGREPSSVAFLKNKGL